MKMGEIISKLYKEKNISAILLAILFAACSIIGKSYEDIGNWNQIFDVGFPIRMLCMSVMYFIIVKLIYLWLDNWHENKFLQSLENKMPLKEGWQAILGLASVFIICWGPYMIAFFPGSIQTDAASQLEQFLGMSVFTDHHPAFSTFLMGICLQIGMYLQHINIGIFIYVIMQTLLAAFVIAFFCNMIRKKQGSIGLRVVTVFYFAFLPVWPVYQQTFIKDTLFTTIVFLFVLMLLYAVQEWDTFVDDKWKISCFVIVMVLMMLLRKNGIYIGIFTLIALLIGFRKQYKTILAMTLLIILIWMGYSKVVLPLLGIESGSIKEMLSIPFQQTARYLQEYPEDISADEIETINNVLDVDTIVREYNPQLSDPVKNTFHADDNRESLHNYYKLWFQMFLRHPDVYIQATIHNTYGYFYPSASVMGGYGVFNMEIDEKLESMGISYTFDKFQPCREILVKITYILGNLPIVHCLYSPGLYTWILLIAIGYLLESRSYRQLIVMVPSITVLLTCIASPVNAYMRYALPIMMVTPIIIYVLLCKKNLKDV